MPRLIDTRRLTGPNLLLPGSGAAAEIELIGADDAGALVAAVEVSVRSSAERAGVADLIGPLVARLAPGWVSLAVAAPVDALLTAADLLEVAIAEVLSLPVTEVVADLAATRTQERAPALVALIAAAEAQGTPCLWDDEVVTLGLGAHGVTWPRAALPAPSDVAWASLGNVPTALITGTNGKTTTTRLVASILRAAGHTVGATFTDGVEIDGAVVEAGDWSGPGGARRVLRDARVTAAALETARGGLLRRGLAVTGYAVAVVTNVADDHLGEFGVADLEAMADVKCLVARGLAKDGVFVINAADARLVARARTHGGRVAAFATDAAAFVGLPADWVRGSVAADAFTIAGRAIVPVAEVPVTFGGAALFNVENALAASLAAHALGADDDAIARGLRALRPTVAETPGRANVVDVDGVTVVLDFAHNPAAVGALWGLVRHLRRANAGGRLVVCVGAPGDRLDHELLAFADAIADGTPAVVVVRELADYLRGRAPGAVPALLEARLRARGVADVRRADDDVSGLRVALGAARPGDVVVLTPLVDTIGVVSVVGSKGPHLAGRA